MPSPVLQALLLADHIYQDKTTGKSIICGVFSALSIHSEQELSFDERAIPAKELTTVGSPFAYISLTEVYGTTRLELRYIRLLDNTALFSAEFGISSDNPLATVELGVPLPVLPALEGMFALELLCENELLGSHRVQVTKLRKPSGD